MDWNLSIFLFISGETNPPKWCRGIMIFHNTDPLCHLDHVTSLDDVSSLWHSNAKGVELMPTNKLPSRFDVRMMDFIGVNESMDASDMFLFRTLSSIHY